MLALGVLTSLLLASIVSSPAAAAAPSLTIVSPTDGAVIGNGTRVLVQLLVSNFAFVQPGRGRQIASPNEGHAHGFPDTQLGRLLTAVAPCSLPVSSGPHLIWSQL